MSEIGTDPAQSRVLVDRRVDTAGFAGGTPETRTPGMALDTTVCTPAVHGRYGLPCPACSAPVQRIVYTSNEANYCPRCQTGGRLLADRSLSRLLKRDWPRSLDELEQMTASRG